MRGVKVTVGPPFYNQVSGPIFLLLILLMGVCALIGWRKASLNNLLRNFLYPLITAIVLILVLFFFGMRQWYALLAFSICGFVLGSIFLEWFRGTRALHRTRGLNYLQALLSLMWGNKARYGGYIVHVGVILMAVGMIGSIAFNTEKEVGLAPGQSATIGQYTLKYEGMTRYPTEKKEVVSAVLSIYNQGKFVGRINSEKIFHVSYEQPVTEVGIRTNLAEDLYVILVGWDDKGVTAFKFLVNPLVVWIWIGGAVLILGTVVAVWPDRRERLGALRQREEQV